MSCSLGVHAGIEIRPEPRHEIPRIAQGDVRVVDDVRPGRHRVRRKDQNGEAKDRERQARSMS